MDITRFSDPEFEVKSWINEMLEPQQIDISSTGTSSFEVQASNLMMKLQLMVQELQSKVQEAGQRMIASVPKAVRDLESLKSEAHSLKQELREIDKKIEIFGKEYCLDVQSLKTLDAVKSRLELSINDLKEANNWSVLTQDLDEILYSKDLQQISHRISNMNRCLQLLKRESELNVSQTEQVALVEGMQRELRQIMYPSLSLALANHNVTETTSLLYLSQDANISDIMIEHYSMYCVGELNRKWDSLNGDDVRDRIQRFFEFLLSFWENELTFCLDTFPDPLDILCSALYKSLSNICHPVGELVLTLFPLESPFNSITSNFRELTSLKSSLDLFISHFEDSTFQILSSTTVSLSTTELGAIHSIWHITHSPFEPYFHKYLYIGRAQISDFVARISPPPDSKSLDRISEYFQNSIQHLLSYLTHQLEACISFTRGLLFNELIQLTDLCCEIYCNLWIENIEACHIDQRDPALLGYLFRLLTAVGDFMLSLQDKQKYLYTEISTYLRDNFSFDNSVVKRLLFIPTNSPYYKSLQKVSDSIQELYESESIRGICYLSSISLKSLNNLTGTLLFSNLTHKISECLQQSSLLSAYTEKEESAFDLAPSNFMTEIGDYLLTLPQLIEPFISGENAGLFKSLSEVEVKLPDTDILQEFSMKKHPNDNLRHVLESLLEMTCQFTQEKYLNSVISLTQLTVYGVSQISTDIVYFKNILGALEMELFEDLSGLLCLLEGSVEEINLHLKDSKFPEHFTRILIDLSSK
ncbi:oligomeric Golgi complex subunit 7 [Oopsacas minuta]|uniref:Conserved oligomeric Golgi complex subunit 7 n=1 Tax=Oopsacas minuta TaxID=111878 RepID=A0AAV7KE30_9METZ|nr:oligomeric Golgi complex subunit 7 [Oopsacas minuta]